MKKYKLLYTDEALKHLKKLERSTAITIVKKIDIYMSLPNPISKAKPLTGIFQGMFRYRIGNYRAIFETNEQGEIIVISILRIDHRKKVYK